MRFKEFLKENYHPGFITDPEEIREWMTEHGRREEHPDTGRKFYTIHPNGVVDSHGTMLLSEWDLEYLPIQFGKVDGDFFIYSNNLRSLKGCPVWVSGEFKAHNNRAVDSYEHLPKTNLDRVVVGMDNVKSLVGIDWSEFSYNSFFLDTHHIEEGGLGLLNIKGLKRLKDRSALDGANHMAIAFRIISKYVGRPDDIFECQAELIENGLEEFAQL